MAQQITWPPTPQPGKPLPPCTVQKIKNILAGPIPPDFVYDPNAELDEDYCEEDREFYRTAGEQ